MTIFGASSLHPEIPFPAAVVEPLYVVSYALEVPSDDGQVAVSRRKTVGLSLVDANARPIDLTPPVRPPQIEKERKLERR